MTWDSLKRVARSDIAWCVAPVAMYPASLLLMPAVAVLFLLLWFVFPSTLWILIPVLGWPCVALVPQAVATRWLGAWRRRLREGEVQGFAQYLRHTAAGLISAMAPLALLAAIVAWGWSVPLWIGMMVPLLGGVYFSLSFAAAGLMRSRRGIVVVMAALFIGISGAAGILPELTEKTPQYTYAGLLALLTAPVWVYPVRQATGVLGTSRLRQRYWRWVRHRSPGVRRILLAPAIAWAMWGTVVVVLPLAAYQWERLAWKKEIPEALLLSFIWLDPSMTLETATMWCTLASVALAVWLGVSLGRLGRFRETAMFFRRRMVGVERRLLMQMLLAVAACIAAAMVPAAVLSYLLNDAIGLPLNRPLIAAASDDWEIMLHSAQLASASWERYTVPAILWMFALGAVCGWLVRYRAVAFTIALVFSAIPPVFNVFATSKRISEQQVEVWGPTSLYGYLGLMAPLTLIAVSAALFLQIWGWGHRDRVTLQRKTADTSGA
jgi:hypothetical protein